MGNNSLCRDVLVGLSLLWLGCGATMSTCAQNKADVTVSPLRGNGVLWMSYGPGIINGCRAVVYRERGADEEKIPESDSRFSAVRSWLSENLERRLNLCPTKPCVQAIDVPRSITLYSDPDMSASHMLLHIPLTAQTLAPKSKDVAKRTEQRQNELHDLICAKKCKTDVHEEKHVHQDEGTSD